MPNGFGRRFGYGRGFGGGMGFGFRGSSPPWPYVGLGRGGLPRCGYFLGGFAGGSWPPAYGQYSYPSYGGAMPFYGGYPPESYASVPPAYGPAPFAREMPPEQELGFLKDQAEAIKEQLEQIEARMRDIESKK